MSWLEKLDPEVVIPFAPRIKRNALIEIVHDGLYVDKEVAEYKNQSPRYVFGSDHGPRYASQKGEEPNPPKRRRLNHRRKVDVEPEDGPADDARSARGKPKGRGVGRAARINGEVTDIDTNGAVPTLATESAAEDAETPMELEEEVTPIVDTLAIGESQETEPRKCQDLVPGTSFCDTRGTRFPLPLVKFNPTDPSMLFLGGKDSLKMSTIADFPSGDHEDAPVSISDLDDNYEVADFAWVAPDEAVVAVFQPPDADEQVAFQSRLIRVADGGYDAAMLHLVNGPVFSLQYQKSTNELLCLSGGERSTVYVWDLTLPGPELRLMKRTEIPIYNAAWVGERHFIGGGIGVIGCWTYTDFGTMNIVDQPAPVAWQTPNTQAMHLRVGLKQDIGFVALLAENMLEMAVMRMDPDHSFHTVAKSREFDDTILDYQFSPNNPELFAILFSNGLIQLWSAPNFNETAAPVHQFSMGDQASAMAFAFSPLGNTIAAAGYNTVVVWDVAGEQIQGPEDVKAKWIWPEGDARWRCTPADDDVNEWSHSLSWDAGGKKIAFGLAEQVAIIRLDAPADAFRV